MISKPYERELVLRLLTFFANIATYSLQYVEGVTKPTLLSILYNFKNRTEFAELTALTTDRDEDISFHAKRLHAALLGVA